MHFISTLLCVALFSTLTFAQTKDGSRQEQEQARLHNLSLMQNQFAPLTHRFQVSRPVEDYANFKYLLVNGYDLYGNTKEVFAKNLPSDMTLVVLAHPSDARSLTQQFLQWLPKERLIIATHEDAEDGFWARDSFPVPVYRDDSKNVGLVSLNYYRHFNGQSAIAHSVAAPVEKNNYIFVGGNLLADENGQCFAVNSYRLFDLTADLIQSIYGCKNIEILPYAAGIGDVDEVIKPLPGGNMLTNIPSYKSKLEKLGYKVTMLPEAGGKRTYANSVILKNLVFMPSYGTTDDAKAAKVYESFGYQVVMIDSTELSDYGNGSLHCITMAYPDIQLNLLLKSLGATSL